VQLGQIPGERRLQSRDALALALGGEHDQRGRRERSAKQVPERVQVERGALARDDVDADLGDVPGRDLAQERDDEGGPTHDGKALQSATLGQSLAGEKVLCAAWLDRVRTTEVCRLTFCILALVVKEGGAVLSLQECQREALQSVRDEADELGQPVNGAYTLNVKMS
jgi:hypothetical protein